MPERPIIFSGPMVRALLDGRKTMTRRLAWRMDCGNRVQWSPSPWQKVQPGDRLWVRESIARDSRKGHRVAYGADHPGDPNGLGWTPSIHMPRWASRLTLIVTAVKVERLQDINDNGPQNDCTAEGVFHCGRPVPTYENWSGRGFRSSEKCMFRDLWCGLHGPESWDTNPEVVALTFTVHKENIDRPTPEVPHA